MSKLAELTDLDTKLECGITKDKQLLHEYFKIRSATYLSSRDIQNSVFFGSLQDKYDEISDIILAMYAGNCIGGARVTLKTDLIHELPVEADGYKICTLFGETIHLERTIYGEISGLALTRQFAKLNALNEIVKIILSMAKDRNCHILFARGTLGKMRLYARASSTVSAILDSNKVIKYTDQHHEKYIFPIFMNSYFMNRLVKKHD